VNSAAINLGKNGETIPELTRCAVIRRGQAVTRLPAVTLWARTPLLIERSDALQVPRS